MFIPSLLNLFVLRLHILHIYRTFHLILLEFFVQKIPAMYLEKFRGDETRFSYIILKCGYLVKVMYGECSSVHSGAWYFRLFVPLLGLLKWNKVYDEDSIRNCWQKHHAFIHINISNIRSAITRLIHSKNHLKLM